MSFKRLCSRVAAIIGPWNCVIYRDIRLLKAHSCRVASPAIAWAMQLLVGVVFVLTNLRHTSARDYICAMRMASIIIVINSTHIFRFVDHIVSVLFIVML